MCNIWIYCRDFNDGDYLLCCHIELKWKEKYNYLTSEGAPDTRRLLKISADVITELYTTSFGKKKKN